MNSKTIRRIITVVVLVLVLGGAGLFYQANKSNGETNTKPSEEVGKVSERDNAPESIDKLSASFQIKQILDKDGNAVEVKPKEDATRVDVFFDPMCPYCAMAHQELEDTFYDLLNQGEIDLYFTPVSFLDEMSSDQYSTRAINAFIEINNNSPEHSLAFLDAIFDPEFQPGELEAYEPITNADLAKVAEKLGVSKDITQKFDKMEFEEWIVESSTAQQERKDIFERFSTPAIFNGLSYEEGKGGTPERVQFTEKTDIAKDFMISLDKVKLSEKESN